MYQIKHLYFHERGEHGDVKTKWIGPDEFQSDEERIKADWKRRYFLTDAQADKKWEEFWYLEAYENHLQNNVTPKLLPDEIARRVEAKRLDILRKREGF